MEDFNLIKVPMNSRTILKKDMKSHLTNEKLSMSLIGSFI
jgi:hypothetical protein